MTMPLETIRLEGPSLNGVEMGLVLAQRLVLVMKSGQSVVLDLSTVERVTPSFANALVMTAIEAVGIDTLRSRVTLSGALPLVREGWSKAIERYERGVRLSTQRPEVA